MNNDLFLYANLYHNFDFNITDIVGNQSEKKSFKEPADPLWKEYFNKSQGIKYLQNRKWSEATGIGIVLGYKQYRAIDIDYIFVVKMI